MNLFFIGCSHTRGDDLEQPQNDAWPALISQSYHADFTNAGVSGGSNERSVYQLVKNLNNYDKFYIAWTFINRFTRYRADNNFEVNFNPHLTHVYYRNDPSFIEYGKIHYTYWYNRVWAFKQWLQQIILVQTLLKYNNKPYLMINAAHNNINRWTSDWQNFNNSVKSLVCFDNMDDKALHQEHQEIQNLISQIDFTHYPGWGSWSIEELAGKYPMGPTNHLLEEGHQSIANFILKHDTN